jgi:RNA polymerase sigma-70 factor (ECF subfamily)
MRRIEGHSPGETARRLGVSVSTLEKRLARAHLLIAQALVPAAEETRATPVAKAEGGARSSRKAALR